MTGYIYQTKHPLSYKVGDIESSVIIGKNLETEIADFLRKLNPHSIAVITDTNVAGLHGDRLCRILDNGVSVPQHWFSVEPGEKSKSLSTANRILDDMLPFMTRDSVIISFGGGVVNNLAGTVSSLLFRGTRLVHIPTTFMAQADAAIGIKQAVNSPSAKNAYGAYHTPLCVFNDIDFMKTLSVGHWRCGLSESVKVGVARSPEFASGLKEIIKKCPNFSDVDIYHLIEETIYQKITGLNQDPYEKTPSFFSR
ncbi:MAG: iron-containing alcohol dehydrogenase [Thermodesulfobacteriota bacterium]|nr:iron-containing alcohol dehydrogenase [Thermodesulfobacteriota bacterium]